MQAKYYQIDGKEVDEKKLVEFAKTKGFETTCANSAVEAYVFLHRNFAAEIEMKSLGYREIISDVVSVETQPALTELTAPLKEARKSASKNATAAEARAQAKRVAKAATKSKSVAMVMVKCWTMDSADKKFLIMSQDEEKLKKLRKLDKRFAHQHIRETVGSSDVKFDTIIRVSQEK